MRVRIAMMRCKCRYCAVGCHAKRHRIGQQNFPDHQLSVTKNGFGLVDQVEDSPHDRTHFQRADQHWFRHKCHGCPACDDRRLDFCQTRDDAGESTSHRQRSIEMLQRQECSLRLERCAYCRSPASSSLAALRRARTTSRSSQKYRISSSTGA